MALRRLEPFDYLVTADLPKRFTSLIGTPAVSAGNGRNGTASLRLPNTTNGVSLTLDSQATWIIGFSHKASALVAARKQLLLFADNVTTHLVFMIETDGTIQVRLAGGTGAVLAAGTTALAAGTTYYLEFKVTIDDVAGLAQLRVNGVLDATLNFSGDTRNGANASANNFLWYGAGASNGMNIDIDDLYICDGTTVDADQPNNDFLGDVRVEALLPSGAGNSAQFTPSAGSNYQNVDDASPDGDTTYNSSGTVNHVDTFAMGDLATATGSVFGVEVINYVKKMDAGASLIAPVIRIGSTDYVGSDDTPGTDWTYQSDRCYDVSPATGIDWTISEVNGMEVGYKKTA